MHEIQIEEHRMVDDCLHMHRYIKKSVPIFRFLEAYIYSQTWLSIKRTAKFVRQSGFLILLLLQHI